jgi:hypothetical protein
LIYLKNGSNLVVCKNLENDESLIQHYINIGDVSSLLDPENPNVGLTNINKIEQFENNLTCTFTRDNNNTNIHNYFIYEPGTKYYMIAAYGQIITDRKKLSNTVFCFSFLNFIQI